MCTEKHKLKAPESVEALEDRVLSAFRRYIMSGPHPQPAATSGSGLVSSSDANPNFQETSCEMASPTHANGTNQHSNRSVFVDVSGNPSERVRAPISPMEGADEAGSIGSESGSVSVSEAGVGAGAEAAVGSRRWAKMLMKLLSLRTITQRHADALLSLKLTASASQLLRVDADAPSNTLLRCPCADRVASTTQLLLELFF